MAAPSTPAPIAVIMPVFNRARLVVEALATIATQSLQPAITVVVDDGSTDGTSDAIENWFAEAKPAPPFRLVRQRNRGAPAARNRAFRYTRRYPLLAFLDSDDLWPADYLQRMTAAFAANPDAVAITTDHIEHNVESGEQRKVTAAFDGPITEAILHGTLPLPSCTVVRTEAFRKAGCFNENYRQGLEDVELFLRMSLLGPWRSIGGEPVIRRVATRQHFGGPDQLSLQHLQHVDSQRRTIEVFQRFLLDLGGAEAIDAQPWLRRFLNLWQNWLVTAMQRSDSRAALTCARRLTACARGGDHDLQRDAHQAVYALAQRARSDGQWRLAAGLYRCAWTIEHDWRMLGRACRCWLRAMTRSSPAAKP